HRADMFGFPASGESDPRNGRRDCGSTAEGREPLACHSLFLMEKSTGCMTASTNWPQPKRSVSNISIRKSFPAHGKAWRGNGTRDARRVSFPDWNRVARQQLFKIVNERRTPRNWTRIVGPQGGHRESRVPGGKYDTSTVRQSHLSNP